MTVRKAIFPAAGLGTRFLPVTKAQPKEMLPLVDKPTIQYGVEEAIESGIEEVIMVIGGGKRAIVDHFDRAHEIEYYLQDRGKRDMLETLRQVGRTRSAATASSRRRPRTGGCTRSRTSSRSRTRTTLPAIWRSSGGTSSHRRSSTRSAERALVPGRRYSSPTRSDRRLDVGRWS